MRPAGGGAGAVTLAAALLISISGCGYSSGCLMPGGVQSVAVEMAENETFYRGDEFVYTRYLTDYLIRKTQVQVRARRNADAIVSARLLNLRRVPLVERNVDDRPDVTLEEGLVGTVEVTLTERCSGRVITQFTLERRAEGIQARGETLATERDDLMRELAEDTAVRLQSQTLVEKRGLAYSDPRWPQ